MHDTPSDVLAANGPLAGLLEDYTPRPMQADMADQVAEAIGEHQSLICEAGTGTGKTFAYLIPAVLSGRKIIISTGTRHLQDQIYEKDLPTVRKATAATASVCVLKGRNNYLCLHRYKALESNPLQDSLMAELHALRDWANSTRSGDVSEILTEQSGLHEHITSTTDNCLGQECDYYNDCHVLKARRRAQETDIVIVNHYLLLSDMALKEAGFNELLPRVDCIIFDEAHQLPELASQYLGVTVSSRQLQDLVTDAGKAFKSEAADIPGFLELLSTLEQATRSARSAFGQSDRRSDWKTVADDSRCRETVELIEERLQVIVDTLKSQAQRGKHLDNCYKRAELLQDRLQSFLHDDENKMVTWLETRGRGFLLHQTPLNIAEAFQSRLNRYECSCIYTSATLTVNNSFEHFAGQLGLDDISTHNWPSPYNFRQQSLLYLPADMPAPNSPGFTDAVLEKSLPVLEASKGRAFLLFTSHRALRYAAELIRDRLPYRILVQGDHSRGELLDEFRRDEHSILLGTNSFWEGVDVKGPALSCVIIDKLPFATPDDPVLKARSARMEEMGRNPFMEYQLPLAVIQLKQGIGRLIRDDRDRGVLMICDNRIREKSYGRVFIKSLPDITITDNIGDIEAFFDN
jgi:ATP-dependent DNA helicase DinG